MGVTTGVVDAFNSDRGYGWLSALEDGRVVKRFFHITQVLSGVPLKGVSVTFTPESSAKGLSASGVVVLGGK